jgi:TnpA family transposase
MGVSMLHRRSEELTDHLVDLLIETFHKLSKKAENESFRELLYVRKRYLSVEALRQAIMEVANATLAARLPRIWGETTTACASDSKQFAAWDQNLLTEWHVRYGGAA